jgi:hypothetical protein
MAQKVQVKISLVTDAKSLDPVKSQLTKMLSSVFTEEIVKGVALIGSSLKKAITSGLMKPFEYLASKFPKIGTGFASSIEKVFSKFANLNFVKKIGASVSGYFKAPVNPSSESSPSRGKQLLGGVSAIAGGIIGIITQLKPVKAILGAIGSIFELIFLPVGLILMAFLAPVLMGLAQLISSKTFQGILTGVMKFVTFMFTLTPQKIANAIGVFFTRSITYIGVVIGALLDISGITKNFRSDFNIFRGVIIAIIQGLVFLFTKFPQQIIGGFTSAFYNGINYLIQGMGNIVSSIINAVNPASWISSLPHLASGGAIVSSGLAVLHSGETVIPANQSFGGHTFNISIHGGNGMQSPRDFANQVMNEIEKRTGRIQRW